MHLLEALHFNSSNLINPCWPGLVLNIAISYKTKSGIEFDFTSVLAFFVIYIKNPTNVMFVSANVYNAMLTF